MANAKADHKSKWPVAESNEFDKLTSGLSISEVETGITFPYDGTISFRPPDPRVGGLLNLGAELPIGKRPEEEREERLSALWEKVRSHTVYKRLHKDADFSAALKVFKRRQKSGANGYTGPYAELRFLNIVARIVTEQANFPDVRPKFASLATSKAALAASYKLLTALDNGVRLDGWPDDNVLRELLSALTRKLEDEQVLAGKRKRRSDDLSPQRWYLDGLIGLLITEFHDASPTIVGRIGAMMGYSIEASTIERRIKEVKARKASKAEEEAKARRARKFEWRNSVLPLAYVPKMPVNRGSG